MFVILYLLDLMLGVLLFLAACVLYGLYLLVVFIYYCWLRLTGRAAKEA